MLESPNEILFFQGDKTIDVSKTYLGFPYIINFCNLTQVRCCTGYVRPIRRVQQAPYPLVKVALEELQVTSGKRSASVTVKNSTIKVAHKKSSNGNTKKNNKKVSSALVQRSITLAFLEISLANCLFFFRVKAEKRTDRRTSRALFSVTSIYSAVNMASKTIPRRRMWSPVRRGRPGKLCWTLIPAAPRVVAGRVSTPCPRI